MEQFGLYYTPPAQPCAPAPIYTPVFGPALTQTGGTPTTIIVLVKTTVGDASATFEATVFRNSSVFGVPN